MVSILMHSPPIVDSFQNGENGTQRTLDHLCRGTDEELAIFHQLSMESRLTIIGRNGPWRAEILPVSSVLCRASRP